MTLHMIVATSQLGQEMLRAAKAAVMTRIRQDANTLCALSRKLPYVAEKRGTVTITCRGRAS